MPISTASTTPIELEEIGLSPLPEATVVLIEWPERAAGALPEDRIDIALSHRPALGSAARSAEITGYGKAAAQVERLQALRQFLDGAGYLEARRRRMAGDASTRSYARLIRDDGVVILMNSPRRPDGPAIYDGKSYSAVGASGRGRQAVRRDRPTACASAASRRRQFLTPTSTPGS